MTRGQRTASSIQNYDRLCVSVERSGPPDGAQVEQDRCDARPDQDFRFIPFRVN